jgi:hypothetical protein
MYERCCPEIHWVPVVDGSGRRRLEMRWQIAAPGAQVATLPAAATASARAA